MILFDKTKQLVRGYRLYRHYRKKYGEDTTLFLCRGKSGDIFLYFRFLKAYLDKHGITRYVFIGDCKNMGKIKELYPELTGDCVSLPERDGAALQLLYCVMGDKPLGMVLNLMWDIDLPMGRCATRLTQPFTFTDSYNWFLLGMDSDAARATEAKFAAMTPVLQQQMDKEGYVKGRTVILSPYAYCVKNLPPEFWQLLAKDLKSRGYTVFVMLDPKTEANQFGVPGTFFTYKNSAAVLQYAGHFVGLRSGFCDIISGSVCNKVILYPKQPEEFDCWSHRADKAFSGFAEMGLASDAEEITLPFARDISNHEAETEDLPRRMSEDREVTARILRRFPYLEQAVE